MGKILGLDGREYGAERKERPVTKAQAGAIITSEIDLAIEGWNKRAMEQNMTNPDAVHLFEIKFERFEYSLEAKAKSELFGYAKLSIIVKYQGKDTPIYDKGRNFKKESELDNTNGYYPEMIIDCMGFLISSGLMYNLAISQPENEIKAPKNASKVNKPGDSAKSKSGNRNTTGRRK